MIMPADPKVGDVNRPENIPGLVFEEVAVKTTGKTVDGPLGPVEGAMVGRELHDDETYSDKVFAPGYGEFYSAHEGDVEAFAGAVDARIRLRLARQPTTPSVSGTPSDSSRSEPKRFRSAVCAGLCDAKIGCCRSGAGGPVTFLLSRP